MSQNQPDDDDGKESAEEQPKVYQAEALFDGSREVWIELEGVRYRLRITQRGKLILQK